MKICLLRVLIIFFRKECNSYGGVVMIFVSNFMNAYSREDLEPYDTEIIWIEIPQVKGILLVCCIYRPSYSRSAFWHKLFWSFVQARDIFNIIVILGDLNIDVLKRNNSHEVDTIINSCRLTHIIHEPNKKYTQQ